MKNRELPPGSDAARAAGCKCPVLDNAHGKGYMGGVKDENGETCFVTSSDCALHWDDTASDGGKR